VVSLVEISGEIAKIFSSAAVSPTQEEIDCFLRELSKKGVSAAEAGKQLRERLNILRGGEG
jgi:hypothetical protein